MDRKHIFTARATDGTFVNVSIEEGRIPGIPVLTIRDEATDALRMAGPFEAMTEATLSTLLDEIDTAAALRQMRHFKG